MNRDCSHAERQKHNTNIKLGQVQLPYQPPRRLKFRYFREFLSSLKRFDTNPTSFITNMLTITRGMMFVLDLITMYSFVLLHKQLV